MSAPSQRRSQFINSHKIQVDDQSIFVFYFISRQQLIQHEVSSNLNGLKDSFEAPTSFSSTIFTETFRRLLSKSKKTEETVETAVVKRRGLLGKIGLKKKVKKTPQEVKPAEEKPVEESAIVEEKPVEETSEEPAAAPLEPEEEKKEEEETPEEEDRDEDEPKEEEAAAEEPMEEDEADAEPMVDECPTAEERDQPEDEASATPREASTGFLCGCL